jgi:DNA-binding NtrC family response regulator
MNVEPREFGEGVLEKLKSHTWPGNVRELENVIERAINLAGCDLVLGAELFDLAALESAVEEEPQARAGNERAPLRSLEEVERETICKAVTFYKGNIFKAALSLGISRNTLYRKMKEYGVGEAVSSAAAAGSQMN